MGDRGYNAGGWAYMKRVRCPLCGKSYLIGQNNLRTKCANAAKCAARAAKRLKKR